METNKTKAEHLGSWEKSGLSQAEYCRVTGLKYSTFQNWKRVRSLKKVEWKPIAIKEDKDDTENLFEFRISGNWKFAIDLRLRF
jgi:hypothetical protein